jgi:hypothetical protein
MPGMTMPGMPMSGTAKGGAGVDRARAVDRVGPQRGRLRDALAVFQQACDEPGMTRDDWIAAVGGALAGLGSAWQEHVEFTEAPNGLFDELLDDSVEVAPDIDHLRRDHSTAVGAMTRANELLAGADGGPTCCTRSTASISPPGTDQKQPGSRVGHRPNCHHAGVPVFLVRRHVWLHPDERHPG